MRKRHKSFSERKNGTNITSGGLAKRVPPMAMIIDQIERDSMKIADAEGESNNDIKPEGIVKEPEDIK